MIRLFTTLCVTGIILVCTTLTYAWGPIGHFAIQRSIGLDTNQICMNLPDAWPNREWLIVITTWFAWSHGVQTNDYGNTVIPNTPTYPNDGRYPGYDIYQLATQKIRNTTSLAKNTAYSFIGHNSIDREVHYDYFLGGTADNWIIHHRDKEAWVDYEIFISPIYGSGQFDISGLVTSIFGMDVDYNNPAKIYIPCAGDAGIIQLAQKIYRKNRRFTASDNSGHLMTIDTVDTINTRMQVFEQEINDGIRAMNINELQDLRALAYEKNWTLDELEVHLQGAVTRAAQRINGAGN